MPDQSPSQADDSLPKPDENQTLSKPFSKITGIPSDAGMDANFKDDQASSDSDPMQFFMVSDSSIDASTSKKEVLPEGSSLGRYRIGKILGQGGFGSVYAAEDEELHRLVAIKIPHSTTFQHRIKSHEKYLREARILASLDHPRIVPIYDVGTTTNGLPFIVSKLIHGHSLAELIRQTRLSTRESVELVTLIADALAYAHKHNLVHRDVKPGNIVVEDVNEPFLIDFGLAIRENDLGLASGHSGSPAYMSPEQATGEGHLVDGRSDIYSLGVVLYELLVGQLPHEAKRLIALLSNVPWPPPIALRTVDQTIPPELERITLKCLAFKASDRYATADQLSEDLRQWLNPKAHETKQSTGQSMIVPKGLRSFDAIDSDFFLELLPGPRDRDGLPESLRFWKSRIEETDPAKTFRLGVIYGPSGCGKSSFVKAGLLPRLADRVRVVYIEATPEETETRLVRGLERAHPKLPKNGRLRDAISVLRREGDGRRKVVLVIDQFEQWLHGDHHEENSELVHALRQCDGEQVQCIVMVRDDFWLALSRFMEQLEIPILGRHNSALIDLFDMAHARKVLLVFGRAYGVLPAEGMPDSDQSAFISQAVDGLAQGEKVISVRLSLFTEMMKGRAWMPATLSQVGGTEGLGVNFLEETFSSRSATPNHRQLQEAARKVLRALLPGSGTDIKGHMRSLSELREAAGYGEQPKVFDDLLSILDGELRLITPTDAGGLESSPSTKRYYQLTHDFLVPSLRNWLTRKQKETSQGRAELLLEDSSGVWNVRPDNRQLPSLFQWVRIRQLVPRKSWTVPQAKMMSKAGTYHGSRLSVFGILIMVASVTGWTLWNQNTDRLNQAKAESLVLNLLTSETTRAPELIREMQSYQKWALPLLHEKALEAKEGSVEKLRCSLAMLESHPFESQYLYRQMLKSDPVDLMVIREALAPHRKEFTERLWTVVEDPKTDKKERLRAAAALSKYSPEDPRWPNAAKSVAPIMVAQEPFLLLSWAEAIEGSAVFILAELREFLLQESRGLSERGMIARFYSRLASKHPDQISLFENHTPTGSRLDQQKARASTAIALLLMGRPENAWALLRHTPDPTVRTLLIDRMAPSGVEAFILLERLGQEQDVSARRALIQALGEYGLDMLTVEDRRELSTLMNTLYREDPDTGIHGSTGYLLRKWGMARETLAIDQELQKAKNIGNRKWYVNSQGQTMSIISNPGVFVMGEGQYAHRRRIDRSYAISTTEVTVEQFERFLKANPLYGFNNVMECSPTPDCPINWVSWDDAAAYCNWLSENEGIPQEQWCYLPNKNGESWMTPKKDFLKLTGYRLPTQGEWENACRSGSTTGYSFGESDEFLGKNAWYNITTRSRRTNPVGGLRPNEHGLFDMHGNIEEWCQDHYERAYIPISWKGGPRLDTQSNESATRTSDEVRVSRGGSYGGHSSHARSAICSYAYPALPHCGFRPARTIIETTEKAEENTTDRR